MSTLDILEKELINKGIFEEQLPLIITTIANSIPSRTIPYRMKLTLAISELMLFISQFRINIKHWNDSIIPINNITFCIAKSGNSKDSSVKAVRKCFEEGYRIINNYRKEHALDKAIDEATKAGYEDPESFSSYKNFYTPPNPLFVAISTNEGFIQHLNDLSDDSLGSGFIYSGEIGAELASNANLTENLKVLAELYDEGNKEVKVLKVRENQSREISHLPVSALFIGSQDNILYEDNIKRKFKVEFTSKLARRSFLIFIDEVIEQTQYSDINEMLLDENEYENEAIRNRKQVADYINTFVTNVIQFKNIVNEHLEITNEVRNLFLLYKRYNEEVSDTIDNSLIMTKLTRSHLQWKALKLSGAIALIEQATVIEEEHYIAAIRFIELINKDILKFEKELVKEPYELFTDYVKTYMSDNTYTMKLHDLRKTGFIPMKGSSDTNLKELVKLANSYDENGVYTLEKDKVIFNMLDKTDDILLTYIECKGTKKQRSSKCATGFITEKLKFHNIYDMLEGDYAYCAFRFKNGIRGKENIDSGCKWIIIDVDSSEITDEETHILLSDLNHYVVRTSSWSNENKFRVIIELDIEVDVPDKHWKTFMESIINDLGLIADSLPKAQIYFSYSDRIILTQLYGNPLEVKPYLEILNNKPIEITKIYTKKESNLMLDNPMVTFDKAFNAKSGEGGRKLIWSARYARELGASKEYTIDLLKKINEYWVKPYEEDYFKLHFIDQINRWEFN